MKKLFVVTTAIVCLLVLLPLVGGATYVTRTTEATYELPLTTGWNLVSGTMLGADIPEKSTCSTNPKFIWIYDVVQKKYVNGQDARDNKYPHITEDSRTFVFYLTGSSWIYTPNDCVLTVQDPDAYNVPDEWFRLYDRYLAFIIDILVAQNDQFDAGWNFLWVTGDMNGKSFDDFKGNCELLKAYSWNAHAQKWSRLPLHEQFTQVQFATGLVFKTANSCRFALPPTSPPDLPN